MRITIRYKELEEHKKLLEQELRELRALEDELTALARMCREQAMDERRVRDGLETVRRVTGSVRRRQAFLSWLPQRMRETGRISRSNAEEMAALLKAQSE